MEYSWKQLKQLILGGIKEDTLHEANIVLFGAAFMGSLSYERLQKKYNIYAFCDNDRNKWGTLYEGLPVISPDELQKLRNPIVIITMGGHYHSRIKQQLKNMGIPAISYIEFLLKTQFEKFDIVYTELLEDPLSKKTYLGLLMGYLTGEISCIKEIMTAETYFDMPEIVLDLFGAVYVECGAYVGDTLEKYINKRGGLFKRIYAFEPSEGSYKALNIRKERLIQEWNLRRDSIIIEQKAVGLDNTVKNFAEVQGRPSNNYIVRKINAGQFIERESISLDSYFKGVDKPSFIKADIEGSEREMILGAENIISNYKPMLAIDIYHRGEDLYEIPLKLRELNPAYKMVIRHPRIDFYGTWLFAVNQ